MHLIRTYGQMRPWRSLFKILFSLNKMEHLGKITLFFSGTASEITPIRSVDKIEVGEGRMGPVTRRLQERFLAIVRGEHKNNHGWLTPVT